MRYFLSLLMILPTFAFGQGMGPSHCIALAQSTPGATFVHRAAFTDPIDPGDVRLTYVSHSMVLIQGAGVSAVTDYTGYIGNTTLVPDVVTMNNSHDSHWTGYPDPRVPHALKGWPTDGRPAEHWLQVGDMIVRNVTTDTRGRYGGPPRPNANSIFIFEVEGLCIGHLGHIHQEPSPEQYALIGRLDVVMAPVDGGMTLPVDSMVKVLKTFKSRVVIPIHWFAPFSLRQFLDDMEGEFDILRPGGSEFTTSLLELPSKPTVVVLQPQFVRDSIYDD